MNMEELENKVILVSKRKIMESGEELFDTYFGKVVSYNENTIVVTRPSGEEESIPYGEEFYEEAKEGLYELKDGSTCEDPNYIGKFVVYENDAAYENYANRNVR